MARNVYTNYLKEIGQGRHRMVPKVDMARFQRQIDDTLSDKELIPEQRKVLNEYHRDLLIARKTKVTTRGSMFKFLRNFSKQINKDFRKVTEEDLKKYLAGSSHLSGDTMAIYSCYIKQFYKWLYGIKGKGKYPEIVDWIETTRKKNGKLPEQMLSKNDIKSMIDIADNPRDRCIVMVLYESACRASEMLGLKIKDVYFDKFGCYIIVDGKTGQRRIRLKDSEPFIRTWINHHPNNKDKNDFLFINISSRFRHEQVSLVGLNKRIHLLADRSEISKTKRVHPHLFRHSRLTELANFLTEQQLKIFAGSLRDPK